MSNRGPSYGLTRELELKRAAAFSWDRAGEARNWVQAVTGQQFKNQAQTAEAFQESLKDGTLLCSLINVLAPNSIKKINHSKIAFMQMENITNYVRASLAYGVPSSDAFDAPALYEGTDIAAVVQSLHSLGRIAQSKGYSGPKLGAQLAQRNVRSFSVSQQQQAANAPTFISQGSSTAVGAGQAFQVDASRNIVKTERRGTGGPTFVGQGSSTAVGAGQAFQVDRSRNVVQSNQAGSSSASRWTQGSHGGATQAGMHDTSRNIVKGGNASGAPSNSVPRWNQGAHGTANASGNIDFSRNIVRR